MTNNGESAFYADSSHRSTDSKHPFGELYMLCTFYTADSTAYYAIFTIGGRSPISS